MGVLLGLWVREAQQSPALLIVEGSDGETSQTCDPSLLTLLTTQKVGLPSKAPLVPQRASSTTLPSFVECNLALRQ